MSFIAFYVITHRRYDQETRSVALGVKPKQAVEKILDVPVVWDTMPPTIADFDIDCGRISHNATIL